VIAQIALTAALLIAATLQVKSIRNQTKLDYGYDENSLYAARLALMEGTYPSEDSRREFFKHAVRTLRTTIYFAVTGLLTLVAAVSCFVPARRATRVDPMIALRCE